MDRIELLRQEARDRQDGYLARENCTEFFYRFFRAYNTSELDEERYGDCFCEAMSNLTPSISDGELIVGKCFDALTADEKRDWNENYRPLAVRLAERAGSGQDSHMAVDYELLLKKGLHGVIAEIDRLTGQNGGSLFYENAKKCLRAVIRLSERYADRAEELARETADETRRRELLQVAEVCRRVPANPARSFREAVQSVHFLTHCLSMNPCRVWSAQQFQLGHPDRYLLPYYERDIADGTLTRADAQLLLDCLGIQINNRVPNGLSSGYMVGGRDGEGRPVANELTEMLMQVIGDIRLVYPSVGLCVCADTPDEILGRACALLLEGHSHPAVFNDDVIAEGLMRYGVPEREAHSYIHSTCVEITPVASSNVWVASPYTNMLQLLLDEMDGDFGSFEELLAAIFRRLDTSIRRNFEHEDENRRLRAQYSVNPLLSCFVNDCLQSGRDIERGGARYNWIMPSFVGMANLVDSLYAVDRVVFREKQLTLRRLKEITDRNFEGFEELRVRLMDGIEKYGNDNDDVDGLFGRIAAHIAAECEKYTSIHPNARLIPSVFCWIMHERFGSETGASPDGRRAGFPLGDGSGPCQGRERNGPTSSILSTTKWRHSDFIGGVALNLKFSKSSLGPASGDVLKSLLRTYLSLGGFEAQINVVDRRTLEAARRTPELYRDLVVRIGGYSDYFVKLPDRMQEEILLRTEHGA